MPQEPVDDEEARTAYVALVGKLVS